jgi:hypothetical protein
MNIDGTLLCEGCAWDLPQDLPPFEMPAAPAEVPLAGPTSGSYDVMPSAGEVPMVPPVTTLPMSGTSLPPQPGLLLDTPPPADIPIGFEPAAEIPMSEDALSDDLPPAADQPPTAVHPRPQKPVTAAPPPLPPPPPPPPAPPRPRTAVPPAPMTPRVSAMAPDMRPRLIVVRGQKLKLEYPIYDGPNVVGRSDDLPADIDLSDQEPPNRSLASRQHACITWENGVMTVEDLNSANGTFVNRTRLTPNQKCTLKSGDYVQTGTVMFQVRF